MNASPQLTGPSAPLAPLLASDLADYCLRAAGPGRVLLVGPELMHLVGPLLAAGCEVACIVGGAAQSIPADVVVYASWDAWREDATSVDLVIGWTLAADVLQGALESGAAALVIAALSGRQGESAEWRTQAFALGWQLHPAAFALVAGFEELTVLALARAGVDAQSPEAMLRAGYHGLAAALIRPGDVVLATDAAQDDAWRILQQQSRCSWLGIASDRQAPSSVEPGMEWMDRTGWRRASKPLDVIITRLLDDGQDWTQELGELQDAEAALVRSGRLVVFVPLVSGRCAQERELMVALERLGFVIDRAWWQSLARPTGLGQFIEIAKDESDQLAIDPDRAAVADALVLMAVKIGGTGIAQNPALAQPNIVAFQRDYLDASLVRLIVAQGLRLESESLRRTLAMDVVDQAPRNSADFGAALCVLLYDKVAQQGGRRSELLDAAEKYIRGPAINPTALRWQVSLTFAVAALHHASGNLRLAADFYARVIAFDVLQFSPLLGTKTTTAAVRLGWIRFGQGDIVSAREAWSRGLDEARRLSTQSTWSEVVGDENAPETFAMPEFAAVMDEAGRLASALRLTAEVPLRPGLAWQWGNRSWQLQLMEASNVKARRQAWYEQLQDAKDWLDGQYHQLNAELSRRAEAVDTLMSTNRLLEAENVGVLAAFRLAHLHAEGERSSLLGELNALQAESERLGVEHDQLLASHQRLVDAANQLSAATGTLLGTVPQAKLPGESIAEEVSRLAMALERLPLKRQLRMLARTVLAAMGRK